MNTGTVSLTGEDGIVFNDRILADFADGDVAMLSFPNEIANLKTGKNGNVIYAFNATGNQCDLVLRVIRASSDDRYLNQLLNNQQGNFAGTILNFAELIKKNGDGKGNIMNDIYVLGGGIFVKRVEAKINVEGDTEQSVAIYTIRFSNAPRQIT